MRPLSRRDFCVALSSLAAVAAALPAEGQTSSPVIGPDSAPVAPADPVLSVQRAYLFDQLPVKKGANGESRAVLHGTLPTGEAVEVHETTLLPVSYTHLDVYKRQVLDRVATATRRILEQGPAAAMNEFNRREKNDQAEE